MSSSHRLRRIQGLYGLLPLALVAVYHLWEHSPIRTGRSGVLERLYTRFEGLSVWLEGVLLVVPLVVIAGVEGMTYVREREPDAGEARARRRHLRLAFLGLVGFLAWHLTTLWLPARALGAGAIRAMALAEGQLDGLLGATAYALGWSALAVALAYGVAGDPSETGDPRGRALLGLVVGVVVWVWGIDLLAAYVAGEPVF